MKVNPFETVECSESSLGQEVNHLHDLNTVEDSYVSCPSHKRRNVIDFYLVNGLKPNYFLLQLLCQILEKPFVDFRFLSLKKEVLIHYQCRPEGDVLILSRTDKNRILKPLEL